MQNTTSEIEKTGKSEHGGNMARGHDLILFDGVCNLCNGWVRFVVKRDPEGVFHFAPLQSDTAEEVLPDHDIPEGTDSIILLRDGRVHTRSGAVLRIAAKLQWPWPLFSVFLVVPAFIRDFVYDVIARNRYKWFGRRDECMIPTPDLKSRFPE